MKRLTGLLIALFAVGLQMQSQVTARSAFSTVPKEVLPSIAQPVRLDMLDYFDSGLERPSQNAFGSATCIREMTDDMLTVTNGALNRITFAVLPLGKSQIIMVINRLETPAIDSDIKFYNSRWEQLAGDKLLPEPTLSDWTGKISRAERQDLENALPFIMADATYDPSTRTLTLTRQSGDFVAEEHKPLVDRLVKSSLTYRWNGKKFTR